MKQKDEIERRFLVGKLPKNLFDQMNYLIVQFYVRRKGGKVIRYRHEGNLYYRVTKTGHGLVRKETTEKVSKTEYLANWPNLIGREVVKRRFRLRSGSRLFELDIFMAQLHGLQIVEVEFPNLIIAQAFQPPPWFGREVTNNSSYNNFSLATRGLPQDFRSADLSSKN